MFRHQAASAITSLLLGCLLISAKVRSLCTRASSPSKLPVSRLMSPRNDIMHSEEA